MGKPLKYKRVPHIQEDTSTNRRKWFAQGMISLAEALRASGKSYQVVAFPFKIGCGLAGGNWYEYKNMIEEFANDNREWDVIIYKQS